MINTILYIGTGYHVHITKNFPQVEKFIFVDTKPRAEFETTKTFDLSLYKQNFFRDIVTRLNEQGFVLKNKQELNQDYPNKIFNWLQKIYYWAYPNLIPEYMNPTILYFHNDQTNQLIKYYISTNILYNWCEELESDIKETDGLIISGFNPDIKILSYFDHPITLFAYTGTDYQMTNPKNTKNNSLVYFLNQFPSQIPKYFSELYVVISESGEKFHCNNLSEVKQIEINYDEQIRTNNRI